jgi:hypothetical protein
LKLNIIFLFIGLVLTVISKILQFVYKSKIGDFIVIPAAIFFVLAILFSTNKFTDLLGQRSRPNWFLGLFGGRLFSSHDDGIRRARQILRAVIDHSVCYQC